MLADRMRMGRADFYPYKIDQSCRFNDNDSAYLYRTPTALADCYKFTYSTWVKRGNISGVEQGIFSAVHTAGYFLRWALIAANSLQLQFYNVISFNYVVNTGTQIFRDVASHYHVLLVVDTTLATEADRVKIYVNGIRITLTEVASGYPPQNFSCVIANSNYVHNVGRIHDAIAYRYLDGYQSESILLIDVAAAATDFGSFKNGIWIPKAYSGSYGTDGFHLDYADSAGLGNDVSGNGNDFTSSGLSTDDQVLDTPTNNYCTLTPLDGSFSGEILANGNLELTGGNDTSRATFHPSTGKWYWEVKLIEAYSARWFGTHGVGDPEAVAYNDTSVSGIYAYTTAGGTYEKGLLDTAYSTFAANDILGFAWDVDANELDIYKNNSQIGGTLSVASGSNTIFGAMNGITGTDTSTAHYNFGQLGFAYTPPAGFLALCSENLPESDILEGNEGMDVVLYEGTGAEQSITDLEFEPDLVWIKNRDQANSHRLLDAVRGVTKEMYSNADVAQATDANGLTAFLSNGFTLGTGANGYNDNGESFVAWCFREGVKYGFDIVSYEGTGAAHAINHNLGAVPELIIVKQIHDANSWRVYHHFAQNKTDPETDYGSLDLTTVWTDNVAMWNDTAPTSTQFTVGTHVSVNTDEQEFIAYLWRGIPGFSNVYSYTGNGNANGPFVYCGFRPRYILWKDTDSAYNWFIFDAERDTYNQAETRLQPNLSNVEGTALAEMDILSNGFKLRSADVVANANAQVYVGIAFAEHPSKYANAR